MRNKGFFTALILIIITLAYFLWVARSRDAKTTSEVIPKSNSVKYTLTEANMRSLQREIIAFIAINGEAPEELGRIRQTKPRIKEIFDEWGTSMKYEKLFDESFRLISAGKDRVFQTKDDIVLDY